MLRRRIQRSKSGPAGRCGLFQLLPEQALYHGGEGGMVVTNNEDLGWECRSFRDHGYDVRLRMNLLAMEEKLPYVHNRVGFNYRMTEIQSMIGLNELKRFDSWNLKRRRNMLQCMTKRYRPEGNQEAPAQYAGAEKFLLVVPDPDRYRRAWNQGGSVCQRADWHRNPVLWNSVAGSI